MGNWQKEHPEETKVHRAKWRAKHAARLKAENARWRSENKDKIRNINLKRQGWTLALFNEALAAQNFKCAICKTDLNNIPQKQVHADHCHLSGVPRGILCHFCNAGLGSFRDDPKILGSAIRYLLGGNK